MKCGPTDLHFSILTSYFRIQMAWLTKNSGTMEVERRDESYLDEELKAQLEADVLPRFPTKQAASLPTLHAIQDKHGWLPLQALEEAAAFLDVPASEMMDIATFYEEYFLEPHGQYVIWVCQSISCELLGHQGLLDMIRDKLGIGFEETTDDGRFTLMPVECLGSCGTAPCALVNHKLHENLTVENFEKIIDSLE